MTAILIVNACSILTDAEVQSILPALQRWDDEMLRPSYGLDACTYSFMPHGQLPNPADTSVWPIFLNRHSIDDGVLGWHDDQAGKTFGRIFVGDAMRYGVEWTVTLSHEAAETRVDPQINDLVALPDGRQTLREACDAVESDDQAIDVDGVKLSNFVLPAYWRNDPLGPWDYQRRLSGPAPALTPGGYLSIFDGSNWVQITAMHLGGGPSWRSQWAHHSHRRPRI